MNNEPGGKAPILTKCRGRSTCFQAEPHTDYG